MGIEILSSLLYYVIAFAGSFQGGLQVTDRRILLELGLGLQEFLNIVVELIVRSLVIPGLGAPDLIVPRVVAPGLTVPALVAPSWVIPGLVTPHGQVSGRVRQASLVVGIEARVFCSCWALLKEKDGLTEKVQGKSELSEVGIACFSNGYKSI